MRQLFVNDQFLLGRENFNSAPTKGQKFTITANGKELTLVEAADYAAATSLFRVDDVRKITEGMGTARQADAYLVTVERK